MKLEVFDDAPAVAQAAAGYIAAQPRTMPLSFEPAPAGRVRAERATVFADRDAGYANLGSAGTRRPIGATK